MRLIHGIGKQTLRRRKKVRVASAEANIDRARREVAGALRAEPGGFPAAGCERDFREQQSGFGMERALGKCLQRSIPGGAEFFILIPLDEVPHDDERS